MRETAYAKLNLALHVRRRRPDGYHELETLFAFCEEGDELTLEESAGSEPELSISGPFADALAGAPGNFVLGAARIMIEAARGVAWQPPPRSFVPRFLLDKRLPVAAGLGGGSADAAAAGRLLSRAFGLFDGKELALVLAGLGADVPACIASRTVVGLGIGAELKPVSGAVSGLPVLLVNPRVQLSTRTVFAAWDGVDRGPLPDGDALSIATGGRNDLEAAAVSLAPVVGEVLEQLRRDRPLLVRMSGSGATCFALYEDESVRDAAEARIRAASPDWWLLKSRLR